MFFYHSDEKDKINYINQMHSVDQREIVFSNIA